MNLRVPYPVLIAALAVTVALLFGLSLLTGSAELGLGESLQIRPGATVRLARRDLGDARGAAAHGQIEGVERGAGIADTLVGIHRGERSEEGLPRRELVGELRGGTLLVPADRGGGGLAVEGLPARQQSVEDPPERVDIRARADLVAAQALGG